MARQSKSGNVRPFDLWRFIPKAGLGGIFLALAASATDLTFILVYSLTAAGCFAWAVSSEIKLANLWKVVGYLLVTVITASFIYDRYHGINTAELEKTSES